jgi:NAD(P)H-hydrate epimerase
LHKSPSFTYNGNMDVLTAMEMRACDRRTVEQSNISWQSLMGNAGSAVASFILREFPRTHRIIVLCGKGNNGGDGMVAARHLDAGGRQVGIVLLAQPDQLTDGARGAYEALPQALRESVLVVTAEEQVSSSAFDSCCGGAELLLDAIFGTGFHPPLRGLAAAIRKQISSYPSAVVSVDLPTGWDSDSIVMHSEDAFRSNAVITFTAPKLAHVFGALTRGPVVVAQIGSPTDAVVSTSGLTWAGDPPGRPVRRRCLRSPRCARARAWSRPPFRVASRLLSLDLPRK